MPTPRFATERSTLLARLRQGDARDEFLRNARESAAQKKRSKRSPGRSERHHFLSSLNQKLRTPLHNIFGYAQLLEAGIRGPLTHQQRADIARISANERNLASLVDAVMNFAQWYDDDPPRLENVPLRDALRAANRQVAAAARLKGVTYHRDLKSVPPDLAVRAERGRLVEIIRQLLDNAVKFSHPGSAITVRITSARNLVAVEVVDTGIGIDEADIELIFHPFVRGRCAYVRAQHGVGLGLAITRTLAHSINGDVSVRSRRGSGSIFRLDLQSARAVAR